MNLKQKKLIGLGVLLLLIVVAVCIFMGVVKTPFNDPLTSFQPPSYIPEGYVSTNNNSTNYDKAFYFRDNEMNQFMVAAIKDTNKSQLTELKKPLAGDNNITITNETINIQGHNVIFQTLKMDFMGLTMNLFHASWTCDQTDLEFVVMGKMKDNETEEMKKMVKSVRCHQEKERLNIFGIKI